jgi:catechol 2,3-dioxygenase-like lactoylglutathione lyase family enzyme
MNPAGKVQPEHLEAVPRDQLHILDHVAVPVRNIAESVEWYRATFRCRVLWQDGTWALLGFANARLALVLPEQHPAHVCFLDDDAERFGKLKEHRDGTKTIYIPDCAGNAVEVMDADSAKAAYGA